MRLRRISFKPGTCRFPGCSRSQSSTSLGERVALSGPGYKRFPRPNSPERRTAMPAPKSTDAPTFIALVAAALERCWVGSLLADRRDHRYLRSI